MISLIWLAKVTLILLKWKYFVKTIPIKPTYFYFL